MAKKGKLTTPDWILKGEKPKVEKKKEKTFTIRRCPKCKSDSVKVVLGEDEGKTLGEWECEKCNWSGKDVKKEELNEEQFMKYLDEKGEEVL